MPIPKPKKNEEKDEFIARCVNNEIMKTEFPDKEQRLAVCYFQWKKHKETKKHIKKRVIL